MIMPRKTWTRQTEMVKRGGTWWIRWRQTATTWAHQKARDAQVQLHDVMRRRSNVTATLYVLPLPWVSVCGGTTEALRWKPAPSTSHSLYESNQNPVHLFSLYIIEPCIMHTSFTRSVYVTFFNTIFAIPVMSKFFPISSNFFSNVADLGAYAWIVRLYNEI